MIKLDFTLLKILNRFPFEWIKVKSKLVKVDLSIRVSLYFLCESLFLGTSEFLYLFPLLSSSLSLSLSECLYFLCESGPPPPSLSLWVWAPLSLWVSLHPLWVWVPPPLSVYILIMLHNNTHSPHHGDTIYDK